MQNKPILAIAGGTGFFGSYLIDFFKGQYSIIVLSRKKSGNVDGVNFVQWDGKTIEGWLDHIEGADVLINLSGKSINCRFSESNKRALLKSRIDSTKALVEGVKMLKNPPKVFFNASAGAMYDGRLGYSTEEDEDFKTDFLAKMALDWERTFFRDEMPNTRRVALRISLILGRDGGVYEVLSKLAKFYLGGFVGSGRQHVSWIHIEDAARALEYIIQNDVEGVVNFSAKHVETNSFFMKKLRDSLGVSLGLPAPAFGLKLTSYFLDIEPALVLNDVNFVPDKLLKSGFEFNYPKLEDAFNELKK